MTIKQLPRRIEVPGEGAEDVLVDEEGHVWTGTGDGSIFRIGPDDSIRRIGSTGGRPLGLHVAKRHRLRHADPGCDDGARRAWRLPR